MITFTVETIPGRLALEMGRTISTPVLRPMRDEVSAADEFCQLLFSSRYSSPPQIVGIESRRIVVQEIEQSFRSKTPFGYTVHRIEGQATEFHMLLQCAYYYLDLCDCAKDMKLCAIAREILVAEGVKLCNLPGPPCPAGDALGRATAAFALSMGIRGRKLRCCEDVSWSNWDEFVATVTKARNRRVPAPHRCN